MDLLLTSIVNFMFFCRFWRISRKFSILSILIIPNYTTMIRISFPVVDKCVHCSCSVPVFYGFVEVVFQVPHYKTIICMCHFRSHSFTSNLNVVFPLKVIVLYS